MKTTSQTKDVLNYLQSNKKGLTQKEAIEKFGAYRLSGIIFSLRKRGFMIDDLSEQVPTRHKKVNGEPRMSTISRYILTPYNNG